MMIESYFEHTKIKPAFSICSKGLFAFLTLFSSVLASFAGQGAVPLQDSVKKVSIRITASEKPPAANLDSLIKAAQIEKAAEARRLRQERRNKSVSEVNASSESQGSLAKTKENTREVGGERTARPETGSPTKSTQKTVLSENPSAVHNEQHGEIDQSTQPEDSAVQHSNIKTSRAYLWIGFMLIVVGVILGLLFGKTALLISIAGMVFVIIGYTIKS